MLKWYRLVISVHLLKLFILFLLLSLLSNSDEAIYDTSFKACFYFLFLFIFLVKRDGGTPGS